jgi:hypothetical protein
MTGFIVFVRPSVNAICGRIMTGFIVAVENNNDHPIITRTHIVFADGRQQQ